MTYEGLRLKINGYYRKWFAKARRKQLKNTDFKSYYRSTDAEENKAPTDGIVVIQLLYQ